MFERVSLLVIVANTILLAFDDPTQDAEYQDILDYCFLAFYTMEMMLKVIAQGFIIGKNTYL